MSIQHNPERAHGLPSGYDDPPMCYRCKNFLTLYDDEYICFACDPPKCESCGVEIDETLVACVNPECPDRIGDFETVTEEES